MWNYQYIYGFINFAIERKKQVSQSSLNRTLTQLFGVLLGIGLAVWVLRGFGILTFLPGGVIKLLFLGAIAVGILSYVLRTWWRF
jgi:Flp pilus assembly protein TadB